MKRCRHCGQREHTPRALQALPMPSLQEATHRSSCLPSLIVGALVVGLAFLNEAVPAAVGGLLAVIR